MTPLTALASLDRVERKMLYATASVPANLLMFLWKCAVLVIAPSFTMLSNALFTLGIAIAKILALHGHGSARSHLSIGNMRDAAVVQRRIYRNVGWLVLGLSSTYILLNLLGMQLGGRHEHYEPWLAIAIAAIAFTEFGLSLGGAIWARRNRQLVLEAIRMANLAGALVLISLTQAAILSFAYDGDATVPNLASSVIFGSCAAAIGLVLVLRPLPANGHSPIPRTQ